VHERLEPLTIHLVHTGSVTIQRVASAVRTGGQSFVVVGEWYGGTIGTSTPPVAPRSYHLRNDCSTALEVVLLR
jgi:hypothetical protein